MAKDVGDLRALYFHPGVKFIGPPLVTMLSLEITNVATGQGGNIDSRVTKRMALLQAFLDTAMAPNNVTGAAGIFQYLANAYILRGSVVTMNPASQPFNTQKPMGFEDAVFRSSTGGLIINRSFTEAFLGINKKAFVGVGSGGNVQGWAGPIDLAILLQPGDSLGLHMDMSGPAVAGGYALEGHLTIVYRLAE